MNSSYRGRSRRASSPITADRESNRIPPYTLLTNDNVEPLRRELQLRGEALRFTHPGYRGLFGGIWRMGRTYFTHRYGACLGPEVFYPVGATCRESRAAFGDSRAMVIAREAQLAWEALRFVEPIADEFGGAAFLDRVERTGDRHVLHVFLPVPAVLQRFTPRDWFLFWRIQDAKFHAIRKRQDRREALVDSCA